MMAAFIVAIRGAVGQAALLGVSAAISRTAVVWGVALVRLRFSASLDNERTEAWFQLGFTIGLPNGLVSRPDLSGSRVWSRRGAVSV